MVTNIFTGFFVASSTNGTSDMYVCIGSTVFFFSFPFINSRLKNPVGYFNSSLCPNTAGYSHSLQEIRIGPLQDFFFRSRELKGISKYFSMSLSIATLNFSSFLSSVNSHKQYESQQIAKDAQDQGRWSPLPGRLVSPALPALPVRLH